MDKLLFLTAGIPLSTNPSNYRNAPSQLVNLNLDGMEMEFVRGVRMNEETGLFLKDDTKKKSLVLTAHAPFYINLNAKEVDKYEASIERILQTIQVATNLDAYSITFHAGFYLKEDPKIVMKQIEKGLQAVIERMPDNSNVWVRPETTGKSSQWGDLDEIIHVSKKYDKVLPCVDFSHLHARSNGGFNTYKDFCMILEKIGNEIGNYALENFHAHVAGIEYTAKGERCHVDLEESDFNYKDLLKALKTFDIKGVLVCESPNIEEDAILLKNTYLEI